MRGFRTIVVEFCRALGRTHTYNPLENAYTLFGFLWGMPVPLFSLMIHMVVAGEPVSAEGIATCFRAFPWHYFFLLHPFIFALVFGAMGTVRLLKDREIRALLREREEKVRQLADANRMLREMDRMRNEFLANVTHDLKSPLVSISGYVEMLREGRLGEPSGPQQEAAEVMLRNVNALLEMINDLLDLARLRSSRVIMAEDRFPLAELVEECRDEFDPGFAEKEILFNVLVDPDIRVQGDRRRIRRIFENLISNSIKFCGNGGRIEVEADDPEGGRVYVRVFDDGCGIPAHMQEKLFDRFWQGDVSGQGREKGTGLGLAIAREIVEAHGGEIEAESRLGAGTTIFFDLPEARSPATSMSENAGR